MSRMSDLQEGNKPHQEEPQSEAGPNCESPLHSEALGIPRDISPTNSPHLSKNHLRRCICFWLQCMLCRNH